jgi:ferrous iron transport protein B
MALASTTTPTIALIGNPNTGKTTLFNALTGLAQKVGNYPGVTVEHKTGRVRLPGGLAIDLLDLPGTYSLAAHTPDEIIAVDVLLGQQKGTDRPDAILSIVDASNLRRNFYLLSQLAETGLPLAIALNMTDVAEHRGIQIDTQALSAKLGVPVVALCAHRRQGLEQLIGALEDLLANPTRQAIPHPAFAADLQRQVDRLIVLSQRPLPRVEAFRALVDIDGYAEQRLVAAQNDLAPQLKTLRQELAPELSLAAQESEIRYRWVNDILGTCVTQAAALRTNKSDRIDRLVTHRFWGLVIFIAINALVFQSIFTWAGPLMDLIDSLFGSIGSWVRDLVPAGPIQSLLVDGVVAGVGGVLIFLPQIAILFFFITVLEACGYMARAAMLMDRLLARCGLSGKSFIPLLSSFACAVPGIMAARTIQDRRDRIATILVAPLMSCSARLPVYILFIAAFIPDRSLLGGILGLQALTLLGMYSLGIIVAIPMAWLLKSTLLKGTPPPFLMELPSYKWPVPRTVALRVYHNVKAFIVRAGSIILAATIVMWALAYFPRSESITAQYQTQRTQAQQTYQGEALQSALATLDHAEGAAQLRHSTLGRAGQWMEPVFRPLGWDWRIGVATLASFPAREIIVSVLGTVYSLGGDHDDESSALRQALADATWEDGRPVFTVPVALSIMVFFALCAQCMSTLAIIQRETRSWGWAAFSFSYMTVLAYLGAFATYQVTGLLGWGG